MQRILIVEDDESIMNLMKINLTKVGYYCECADNGKDAADLIEQQHFDLGLFDIMVPLFNGYELLDYAASVNLPVIFVSALDTQAQKIKGLKLGAEDYISKPFDIAELVTRVEVVLRRYHKVNQILTIHGVTIDMNSHRVLKDKEEINLTLKEYEVLALLVQNRNIALSRETIYENVWGADYMPDSRTVDLHIQRIKKKLEWSDKIKTVYKVGYRLEATK